MASQIQKEAHIQSIFDMLCEGVTDRKELFSKFYQIEPVADKTFTNYYKIASQRFLKHQEAVNLVRVNQHTQMVLEGKKTALKSKIERLSEKQSDVDRLRGIADKGTTMDIFFDSKTGQPIEYERPLTATEIGTILKRATEIEAEISKIEGDYAATKHLIQAQVFNINIESNGTTETDYHQLPEVE